jgi:hypothetical protein
LQIGKIFCCLRKRFVGQQKLFPISKRFSQSAKDFRSRQAPFPDQQRIFPACKDYLQIGKIFCWLRNPIASCEIPLLASKAVIEPDPGFSRRIHPLQKISEIFFSLLQQTGGSKRYTYRGREGPVALLQLIQFNSRFSTLRM